MVRYYFRLDIKFLIIVVNYVLLYEVRMGGNFVLIKI